MNGGTQSINYNGEYYEGLTYQIENPTKSGYAFIGWTLEGTGASIDENGLLTVGVSNMTLTANWTVGGFFNFVTPNGGEQTWTVPETGTYKLEVWGAQGGDALSNVGGFGGYSSGEISLVQGQVLNINVGGKGGGIAGSIGDKCSNNYCSATAERGGTETYAGAASDSSFCVNGGFGYGGSAINSTKYAAGGGGGWYGGGCALYNSAGGGSGYIKNLISGTGQMYSYCIAASCTSYESNVDNTKTDTGNCTSATATANCAKSGNGYARITKVN